MKPGNVSCSIHTRTASIRYELSGASLCCFGEWIAYRRLGSRTTSCQRYRVWSVCVPWLPPCPPRPRYRIRTICLPRYLEKQSKVSQMSLVGRVEGGWTTRRFNRWRPYFTRSLKHAITKSKTRKLILLINRMLSINLTADWHFEPSGKPFLSFITHCSNCCFLWFITPRDLATRKVSRSNNDMEWSIL